MPAREKRRETTAGLFVLVGLLILGTLVIQFGRFGDRFSGNYPIYIEFPDTGGIIKGSEIRLRGAKIGTIATKPELTIGNGSSTVRMEMRIKNDVKIPVDSTFQIASSGFIGDTFIDIKPPEMETGEYYKSGSTIMGVGAGGFDVIKSQAQDIAQNANELLIEAKDIFVKLDTALDEITGVGEKLNVSIERVNTRFLSEENLDNLSKAIANLENASEDIGTASKKLEPTIADARKTFASLSKAADSADLLLTDTRKEIRHIEPALRELPDAIQSISNAAGKAEKTMDALQSKDSLIGAVAYDQETGSNAKDFIRNLKRYGILGYRDQSTKDERDPRRKFRGSRR